MDLLTVVKAPCIPFSARPRSRTGRLTRPCRVVQCTAQNKTEDDKLQSAVKQLGKACAPFAAAVLLLAQASPATAETQFQASIRRQQEFFSGKKSGGLDSFFKKGADTAKEGASSAAEAGRSAAPEVPVSSPGGALDSAKGALGDAASAASSTAKAAAPDDASQAGKDAASSIADGAKSVLKSSQKEAEVAGTGDSNPTGGGLTSKAVDSAKSAAGDLQDNTPNVGVGNAGDAASSAASEVKGNILNVGNPLDSAKSAAKDAAPDLSGINPVEKAKKASEESRGPNQAGGGPSNLDNAAAGDVKGIAPSIGGGNSANEGSAAPASAPAPSSGGGGGFSLDSAVDAAKSAAGDATNNAQAAGAEVQNVADDSPKSDFLSNFLGVEAKSVSTSAKEAAPQPSDLEEKLPEGVPPLPDQPAPEPESKQLGVDTAGGKVQDVARGSGALDLFGGDKTGKSPESKAEDLVDEAKKPNPGSSFLGNLFGIDQPKEPAQAPDFGLSALPSRNEVGTVAEQLEPPQPSDLEEAGNLPESSPGQENKLPEQPAPEAPPPEALGQDSPGGKTASTKSGGGLLDFFGGSQSSLPGSSSKQQPVSLAFINKPLVMVVEKLAAPQPSEFDEKLPESSPGRELVPDEQPLPEPASKSLPQDNSGGETQDTKRGSGGLDFFGGSDSGNAEKAAEKNIEKAKSPDKTITPETAKVDYKLYSGPEEAISLVAEAEAPAEIGGNDLQA